MRLTLALGLSISLVGLTLYIFSFMYRLALLFPTSSSIKLRQETEQAEADKQDEQQTTSSSSSETTSTIIKSSSSSSAYFVRASWFVLYNALPACALAVTFSFGFAYHYSHLTTVSCEFGHPRNLIPSISATIGDFAFNRQVWNAFISMYAGARLCTGLLFWFVYKNIFEQQANHSILLRMRNYMHYIEQFSLVGLTVVTSKENLLFHQIYFAVFWAASICCLSTTTYLTIQASKQSVAVLQARLSNIVKWRKILLGVHLVSSVGAIFWYFAHETKCGDYYYTFFAIAEWTLVLSNIVFHSLGEFCDGKEVEICVRFLQGGRDEELFGRNKYSTTTTTSPTTNSNISNGTPA